jgi:RHS repeat-associated protein
VSRIFRDLLLALICLLVASTAYAQGPTPGTPSFGSFTGGPDTIDLGNLNIHFDASIAKKPGRGMPFSYTLAYDSSLWYQVFAGGTLSWVPVDNWGWTDVTQVETGYAHYIATQKVCRTDGQPYVQYNFKYYRNNLGVRHPFTNLIVIDPEGSVCSGIPSATASASDGSGYTMTVYWDLSNASVVSPSGVNISAPVDNTSTGYGSLTDRNGNIISTTGTVFTDTLNTSVVTVSYPTPAAGYSYERDFAYLTTGSPATIQVLYKSYEVRTAFGCSGVNDYPANPNQNLVDTIKLPDGTAYTFTYEKTDSTNNDVTGRVASIGLPTGGSIAYTYSGGDTGKGIFCADGTAATVTRAVNTANSVNPGGTWTYSRSETGSTATTTITDPAFNETDINFQQDANTGNYYETERKSYTGTSGGGTLLQTVDTCYNGAAIPCTGTSLATPFSSRQIQTTMNGAQSKSSLIDYCYQAITGTCAGATELPYYIYEYDFGGALLRSTAINYATNLGNIYDQPSTVIVRDGNGTRVAETDYYYDQYSLTATTAPQHTSVSTPRANLTTVSRWLSTGGSASSVYHYDDAGNVLSYQPPNGSANTVQFTYGSGLAFGFVTQTTYPSTTAPGTGNGTVNHITYANYDINTGLLTSSTDLNGQATTYNYDSTLRPSSIISQPLVTGGPSGQTTFSYWTPANSGVGLPVTGRFGYLDGTHYTQLYTAYDGLGRSIYAKRFNDENTGTTYDQNDYCYNSVGEVYFSSYTHLPPANTNAQVCSGAGDSYTYDGLGRQSRITHADGTHSDFVYYGRATQVTDEGNGSYSVQHVYQNDGLGRQVNACEVAATTQQGSSTGTPTACNLDIAGTGFLTTYGYDPLDNQTSVTQGGVNRAYYFDSLSRMLASSEPEAGATETCSGVSGTWSVCYTYDSDGNPLTRVRPRPNNASGNTTTNYGYDALDRLTGITYTAPAGQTVYSPAVTYDYDQQKALSDFGFNFPVSYTNGRLSGAMVSGTAGTFFGYDTHGNVTVNDNCTVSTCGAIPAVRYGHDLQGNVLTATDGEGHTYTATYNQANRITSLTSSYNDSQHPPTLLSNLHYGVSGGVGPGAVGLGTANTNGTVLSETRTYQTGSSVKGLLTGVTINNGINTRYSLSGLNYAPNAQITAANDSVNGNWSYTYDEFNRLKTAISSGNQMGCVYQYDRFGNRWKGDPTGGTGYTCQAATNLTFNNSQNHIDGYSDDALGNLLSDGSHTYQYDEENRLISIDKASPAQDIQYDAFGRRIRDAYQSSEYIYDQGSHVIAAVAAGTGAWTRIEVYAPGRHVATYMATANTTYFEHADWLGTDRLRTNVSGGQYSSATNYPFGEGTLTADPSPVHFAGLEHDGEDNLEHAWFRQYKATLGRWNTVDPAGIAATDPANPQSWNRYAYTANNPLNMIDPFGLDYWWSGDCLFYDQYAYVNGKLDSVDTFFIGCFGGGGGGYGGSGGGVGGGGASGQTGRLSTTKKFTSPCPPVPDAPHIANIDQNVARASTMRPVSAILGLGTLVTSSWLYGQVRNKGPWDYKQITSLNDFGTRNPSPYGDFGNFNFGATGSAAGLPLQELLRGAGWAQQQAGTSQPNWGNPWGNSPYGDDPHDQAMIGLGISYAQSGCHQ